MKAVPSTLLVRPLPVMFLLTHVSAAFAADTQAPLGGSATIWRAAATSDVAAAYALVHENHPAVVPAAGDPTFRDALEQAHRLAAHRAADVESYAGYVATLAAFSAALRDEHIRSRPSLLLARPLWAGLIMGKRGDHWVVVDEDADPTGPLQSARLLSCDGRTAQDLAREILGNFRGDWSVGAQQILAAPWLLVDEGNPFVTRPRVCVFDQQGTRREVTLNWRSVRREVLMPRLHRAMGTGAAGYGVRPVGDGYWIALQSLEGQGALNVLTAVREQMDALRAAKFVVLDVRGNGGGSSAFGRRIAEDLMGKDRVEAILGPVTDCDDVFRISPANLDTLVYYRDVLVASRPPEVKEYVEGILAKAKAARDAGRDFTESSPCAKSARASADGAPPSKMRGRMLILTDARCFSSCLSVTDEFRQLGALHLGQTTDANTRYTEVRDVLMPSGFSTFSTMMAMNHGMPLYYGNFVPSIAYEGDMGDTAALQAWVVDLLRKADSTD